jgi:hypothetical protein
MREVTEQREAAEQGPRRQVIKIAYIENKAARQITFSKRRAGGLQEGERARPALRRPHHCHPLLRMRQGAYPFGSASVDGVLRPGARQAVLVGGRRAEARGGGAAPRSTQRS